jgi:ferrous iron transport protein B
MSRPQVVLAGLPNCGKTSLFNALTGANQKVANYPGVTVEKKTGLVQGEVSYDLTDLPGIYSLDSTTLDEKVAKDILLNKNSNLQAQLIILVFDATNIRKSLYLALQLKEIGARFIIVLNMADIATARGQELKIEFLEQFFKTKVVYTANNNSQSISNLQLLLQEELQLNPNSQALKIPEKFQTEIKDRIYIKEKMRDMDEIEKNVIVKKIAPDSLSAKIDRYVLHPIWGFTILFTCLLLLFQLLFVATEPLVGVIEGIFELLANLINQQLINQTWKSFWVDGVIAGIGSVVVFLPHILFLFLFLQVLEDCGYLTRAVFLLDSLMRRLGLPGKSVIPLLSSHACAIPGIMSARIIESQKDRMATILVAPLTTCSARLPVYTMLIAALMPAQKIFGLDIRGLGMFALYLIGMASALIISFVLKKSILNGPPTMLLMELPSYRLPKLRDIFYELLQKTKLFFKKVGTIIFVLSMVIWLLVSFPKNENGVSNIHTSYAAKMGHLFTPIFAPIGFDWRITTALIPSFGAREVVISSLSSVLAVESDGEGEKLSQLISREFSLATLLSLLAWFIYAPQCISTFAVLKKESNSWKWPALMGVYTLALAYLASFFVYWGTTWLVS